LAADTAIFGRESFTVLKIKPKVVHFVKSTFESLCTLAVLDVVKLPAAVVHVVVSLRFSHNLVIYFKLNIDALAPESNRIRMVLGLGLGLPILVRILPKRIGTRSFCGAVS
jgi:hypothetical protein